MHQAGEARSPSRSRVAGRAAMAEGPRSVRAASVWTRRWRWGWPALLLLAVLLAALLAVLLHHAPTADAAAIVAKRSYSDQSVRGYLTERACWWNEICKEEFQTQFRCKCPQWSYCRSPGRYYNAYCTVTGTGYIWTQPGWGGSAAAAPAAAAGA